VPRQGHLLCPAQSVFLCHRWPILYLEEARRCQSLQCHNHMGDLLLSYLKPQHCQRHLGNMKAIFVYEVHMFPFIHAHAMKYIFKIF
jgi:hypothetical protein